MLTVKCIDIVQL